MWKPSLVKVLHYFQIHLFFGAFFIELTGYYNEFVLVTALVLWLIREYSNMPMKLLCA